MGWGIHLTSWKQFEARVADIFVSAGFIVERNKQMNGFEFDIVATRRTFGSFDLRIGVECKWRTDKEVGNNDVHEFVVKFRSIQSTQEFTHGIMVTNTRFSRNAYESSYHVPAVRLVTLDMLEDELIGGRLYLENSFRAYKADSAAKFINLSANLHPREHSGEKTQIANIVEYCSDVFEQSENHFVFLLGDFGTGKTTVAEQVHRTLAERFLAGGGNVFPVIQYLRTLQSFDTEESFIQAQIRLAAPELGLTLVDRIRDRHKLLYILDGFDEIATNAVEDERMGLLSRVMRIAAQADHLLLTSRPSYFTDIEGINRLVNALTRRDFSQAAQFGRPALTSDSAKAAKLAQSLAVVSKNGAGRQYQLFHKKNTSILEILPLAESDIEAYLRPHQSQLIQNYGRSVPEIVSALADIYDLSDLLTRPIFLSMLCEILLANILNINDPNLDIGAAGVYQIYVNAHLDRDWNVRQFLTRDERLAFARAAAVVMLEAGGSLEASKASIARIVARGNDSLAAIRRSELLRQEARVEADVKVCSFITLTTNDQVAFSHKSFMEYFVADTIVAQLEQSAPIEQLRSPLNYEILYFVGSYCIIRGRYFFDLIEHLNKIGPSESDVYRTNIRVALLYARRVSEDAKFFSINYESIKISKKTFKRCSFEDFILSNATFRGVCFDDCTFTKVTILGEVGHVTFTGCTGEILIGPKLGKVVAKTCCMVLRGSGEVGSRILKVEGGNWSQAQFELRADATSIIGVNFQEVSLVLPTASELALSNCSLTDVRITRGGAVRGATPKPVRISITGCELQGVSFADALIKPESFAQVRDHLADCTGVLFILDEFRAVRELRRGLEYVGWAITGKLLLLTSELRDVYLSNESSFTAAMDQDGRLAAITQLMAQHGKLPPKIMPEDFRRS